jgi:zinc transport system substrate-binding protein
VRKRNHLLAALIAVAGVSLISVGCNGCNGNKTEEPWASAKGRPKVLVSFAPIYSFAVSVAGEDADVKCLLTTTGPHNEGDASTHQIDLARGCDVFFINGLGLEDEADGIAPKLGKAAANPKWNVVNLSEKIPKGELLEGEDEHEHHGKEEKEEHPPDPHVWLSAKHAKVMVVAIRDELKRLDPAHAEGYDRRAADYLKKLDALERDGKAMLANKKERKILSFHDSLNYFAKCYGLEIVGSIELTPGREPEDDKLKQIIELCKTNRVRVIASEPQFSTHTSARVIRDALRGLKDNPIEAVFAEIDPLETSEERKLGPDLYERTMRSNLTELAKALR